MTPQYIKAVYVHVLLLVHLLVLIHILYVLNHHHCSDDTAVYRGDALWRRLSQLEAVVCTHTLESRLHEDDDDGGDNEHYFYYFLECFAR